MRKHIEVLHGVCNLNQRQLTPPCDQLFDGKICTLRVCAYWTDHDAAGNSPVASRLHRRDGPRHKIIVINLAELRATHD